MFQRLVRFGHFSFPWHCPLAAPIYLFCEAKRAEDARLFTRFVVEIGDDEAVVAVEGGYEVGEVIRADAAAELAVELVSGLGSEGKIVDGLDGGA